jgi:hypothetical protein
VPSFFLFLFFFFSISERHIDSGAGGSCKLRELRQADLGQGHTSIDRTVDRTGARHSQGEIGFTVTHAEPNMGVAGLPFL